jgi:hypothetical protein
VESAGTYFWPNWRFSSLSELFLLGFGWHLFRGSAGTYRGKIDPFIYIAAFDFNFDTGLLCEDPNTCRPAILMPLSDITLGNPAAFW